jgi:hypothetical protein
MSTVKVDTLVASDGTSPVTLTKQEALKCHFRSSGTYTGFQTGSLNCSSLTDNGTGDFTASWTNSFSGATYTVSGTAFSTGARMVCFTNVATGSCEFVAHTDGGADIDVQMSGMVSGGLA